MKEVDSLSLGFKCVLKHILVGKHIERKPSSDQVVSGAEDPTSPSEHVL